MNLPSLQRGRQVQACLTQQSAKPFARADDARNDADTKLYRTLVLFLDAVFRNPSPLRQSGASMYLLPPFLQGASVERNFERDLLCQKQPKFSLLSLCLAPLQPASALNHKFKTLQAARHLVQRQPQSRVATLTKLSQAASLVPQLARWLTHKPTQTPTLCRVVVADVKTPVNAVLPLKGRAAFSRF